MKRIDLTLPTSWKELSKEQIHTIAVLMNEQLTREELLFVLFCKFARVKKTADNHFVAPDGTVFDIEPWQLADFCNRLAYIMDEMPEGVPCPINVDDFIADITFENYFHADALMAKYRQCNDKEIILSVMDDLGDPHEVVSDVMAVEMMLWWTSLQQYLKDRYPNVFTTDDTSETSYHPWIARQNILLMLNDDRPQDNVAIEKSLSHDVLAALDHKIARMKAEEAALNRR